MQKPSGKPILDLPGAIKEANRCLLCKDAPCSQNCPSGTDPAKFIRQIRFENYKGAARTIRDNNPLGMVCAYICPVEKLCEAACCFKTLGEPIDISGLQRFACSYGKEHKLEPLEVSTENNNIKIAVIGAGPAGIGCAATLAKAGYSVIIFEKNSKAGGVATWNIPEYRLPTSAIHNDLKNLTALGVKIKYNAKINTPDAAAKLLEQGFAAVFVATGLTAPISLSQLHGYKNVVDYSIFLRAAKTKSKAPKLNDKTVLVIGGGNVAADAACVAVTAGAKKVYMMLRRGLANLAADREEMEYVHALNVIIKPYSQITRIKKNQKNEIISIEGAEFEIPATASGKANTAKTKKIPGSEFKLPVDYIIQAIGTKPGEEVADLAANLAVTPQGTIQVKKDFATNIPGIFAGGDVVNGGATIAQAVGEGKQAAQSIMAHLKGHSFMPNRI